MTYKEYFTREEFVNMVEAYNKAEKERQELKAENARLKEELRIESLTDKTTGETIYRSNLVNKYRIILQEIRTIANNIAYSDEIPTCINDKECPLNGGEGFDNYCNMRCPFILGKQILDLITKAESEG